MRNMIWENHNKPDRNKLESLELEGARQLYPSSYNKLDNFFHAAIINSTHFKSSNIAVICSTTLMSDSYNKLEYIALVVI